MALKDVVKVSRKTFFNPRGWFGYDQVKSGFMVTWGVIRGLFIADQPTRTETFSEAMQRLNLTEEDVQSTAQHYFMYACLFLVLCVLTACASLYYLFHHGSLSACLLGFATAALFLSQAFRYHFWYFQIKVRKLGCTLAEWRRGEVSHDEGQSS